MVNQIIKKGSLVLIVILLAEWLLWTKMVEGSSQAKVSSVGTVTSQKLWPEGWKKVSADCLILANPEEASLHQLVDFLNTSHTLTPVKLQISPEIARLYIKPAGES